jgi:hypothetical protein
LPKVSSGTGCVVLPMPPTLGDDVMLGKVSRVGANGFSIRRMLNTMPHSEHETAGFAFAAGSSAAAANDAVLHAARISIIARCAISLWDMALHRESR